MYHRRGLAIGASDAVETLRKIKRPEWGGRYYGIYSITIAIVLGFQHYRRFRQQRPRLRMACVQNTERYAESTFPPAIVGVTGPEYWIPQTLEEYMLSHIFRPEYFHTSSSDSAEQRGGYGKNTSPGEGRGGVSMTHHRPAGAVSIS